MLARLGRVAAHVAASPTEVETPVVTRRADLESMVPDVALLHKPTAEFSIPSRRAQADLRAVWIEERVQGILPGLMDASSSGCSVRKSTERTSPGAP